MKTLFRGLFGYALQQTMKDASAVAAIRLAAM